MPSTRNRSRLVALLLLVVFALLAAACGDDSEANTSSTTAAPSGTEAPSGADPTEPPVEYEEVTIKFADPGNAGAFAYAKREGILEEELAKVNAKIEWVPAAGAFSANLDAMRAGNINASQAAIAPIVGALANGLDFKIFGISDPAPEALSSGIVATKDSGITTIADLVGKRVAVNPAAKGDYLLLKALQNEGIPFDQVERVPIQPTDAAAAFASGDIDAWATFNVFFQQALGSGATLVAYESDLESDDVGVIAASSEVLEKNPAAFQVLIDVYTRLVEEGKTEPEKFQNVFDETGPTAVTGERLEQAIEDTKAVQPSHAVGAEDIARVQAVADLFFEGKSIQKTVDAEQITFDLTAALG